MTTIAAVLTPGLIMNSSVETAMPSKAAHAMYDQSATIDPLLARLQRVADADLIVMHNAGREVLTCLSAIGRAASNPVARILRGGGEFYEDAHYPDGDIFDAATASQYYYHAHRVDSGEHGHFHTFIRAAGIPASMDPYVYTGTTPPPSGDDAICHLVALSMDANGLPTGVFTTNRWVTAETFYPAQCAIELSKSFRVDHADPCWATNRWLTAMLQLFRPQIIDVLHQRDARLVEWQRMYPDRDCFEDRELEVMSECAIDIDDQIAQIDAELARRNLSI